MCSCEDELDAEDLEDDLKVMITTIITIISRQTLKLEQTITSWGTGTKEVRIKI